MHVDMVYTIMSKQTSALVCLTPFVDAGQADSRDFTPQQHMELLSTCDGRIQALMAEADLLGQPVQGGGSGAAADALEAQVRHAFASILIESGTGFSSICFPPSQKLKMYCMSC